MPHNPAHQDAPTSQGTRPTPTVPPIVLVYAFRYVWPTIQQHKHMFARAKMHTDTAACALYPTHEKLQAD